MCDDTGYMYNTIAGNYKYQYLSRQVLVDVINYLEGDFNIAMNLPYKKIKERTTFSNRPYDTLHMFIVS